MSVGFDKCLLYNLIGVFLLWFITSHLAEANELKQLVLKPIPEKLVVLTFDDSCASHATYVGPVLKEMGFGATFYISNFGSFEKRKIGT